MRVLQLIDSLNSGGAETMAVSYANALTKRIERSFLCCTRAEGLLRQKISGEVGYLFLNKRSTLDIKALLKLRNFVRQNKIDLIHAHGTSWFLGVLVKITLPQVKLVWHDHYGRDLQKRKTGVLKYFSSFFDGAITVNSNLREWVGKKLGVKNVKFFRNFLPVIESTKSGVKLEGSESFKIICVANFRPQKDHLNLLKAFDLLKKNGFDCELHLIGKVEPNNYSNQIKTFISDHELKDYVFIYGEQPNSNEFLLSADLGVLSSSSEGLPVALLEYGLAGLPVVCTRVGECAEVIELNGKAVKPGDPEALAEAMKYYMLNDNLRKEDARKFKNTVLSKFSEEVVIPEVINFFKKFHN